MRGFFRVRLVGICAALFASVATILAFPGVSSGHGSLPISQEIMWRGDTMLVPAAYWGLFIGTDGGPWQWICEEAINANQSRQMAFISDGTLYATDRQGVTVSRDSGCTWAASTSAIAQLQVVSIVADPKKPRAWAVASSSDNANNGLWYSDDKGQTFTRLYAMPDHLPSGLRISEDGQTIVVSSVTNSLPRQAVLHVSKDGGANFTQQSLNVMVDGAQLTFFKPTWIDPRPPSPIYIQTDVTDGDELLRIDGTAQPVAVLHTPGIITAMALNPSQDHIFVATTKGLYSAATGMSGSFSQLQTLGAAQCLSPHNGTFYACAWNYAPDLAAIAKLANDGSSFSKVFQFADTQNPVSCPEGTPVAQICPMVWYNYADQLGITLGADMGGSNPPPAQSGCSMGTATKAGGGAIGSMAVFLVAAAVRRRKRRAA